MAFRDEIEALRARVASLEGELAEARAEAEGAERARRELTALRAQVADLERRLGVRPRRSPRLAALAGGLTLVLVGAAFAVTSLGGGVDWTAAPTEGWVAPTEGERAWATSAFGDLPASRLAQGCPGFVPRAPALGLDLPRAAEVAVWTESSDDLVLVVRDANGVVWCDDDSGEGRDARVEARLDPGTYRVWVGTYHERRRASLTLHARLGPPPPAPHPSRLGLVRLGEAAGGEQPDEAASGASRTLTGSTVGEAPVREPGCAGFVPAHPTARLASDEARRVTLDASARADLVLLLRRADGAVLCDDDGGQGLDPRLLATLGPGEHDLWVGTYARGARADFSLRLSSVVHRLETAGPRLGRWDLTAEPLLSFSGEVAALAPLDSLQPGCQERWSAGAPDLELALTAPRAVSLYLDSEAPVGLSIAHPDGTRTCTASGDLTAQRFAAGTHRVSVTVPEGAPAQPFTLVAHAHRD